MRKIKDVIFFGNLDCFKGINAACTRLEDAFDIVGGMQQPDHPTSDEHAKRCVIERQTSQKELEDCLHDIAAALGLEIKVLTNP